MSTKRCALSHAPPDSPLAVPQAEVERKAKQNEHILEDQAKHIAEVEKTYRDEVTRRKGLFNQLEDIRGKLRVYCRVRPPASVSGGMPWWLTVARTGRSEEWPRHSLGKCWRQRHVQC